MSGINLKWAALFLFLILLPAAVLTYLSARAFRDEQRSALAELQRFIPLLQQTLDQRLEDLAARVAADPIPQELDLPQLAQLALLDQEGRFLYPRYLPLSLAERSPDFAPALQRGVELEFAARDLTAARLAYEAALPRTRSPREIAETLNALGRVGIAAGRLDAAIHYHRQLEQYPWTFDPDGAHPLTLSYLRLVGHLPPDQATLLLEGWTQKVLAGEYPLFPGCRHLVEAFAAQVRRLPRSGEQTRSLRHRLDRIGGLVDLIDIYYGLAATGVVAQGTFSGVDAAGQSFLVHLQPRQDDTVICRFDLDTLAADLLRSPAGLELQNRGFGASLFDLDDAARLDLQRRRGLRQVAPASQSIYRLNLGLYPRDEAFVLRNYRNRNLFIMAGIFLLAGAIAGGAYLLFRDTTRELQTARLRSEFVANLSHELRTPLTAIRMYAETLLLGRYRSQQQLQEYLETILRESQRLSRMVGNVLDFSRMESGRKTYDFADLHLETVVQQVAEEFGPLLQEREMVLQLEIQPGLPPVRADAEAVTTALANLLNNAVKYSGEGRAISLSVRADDPSQIIEVADRGIGVPPAEAGRIFEKFYRAANAGDAATGTGLGLALVSSVARAHGGSVEYLPRVDGGSLFRLKLPVSRPEL